MRHRTVEINVAEIGVAEISLAANAGTSSVSRSSIRRLIATLLGACLFAAPGTLADALAQSRPPDAHVAGDRIAFLSEHRSDDSESQAPAATPQANNTLFDGKWIFTSAGCTNTGSLPALIRRGKIIVKGGSGFVEPDGTLHSVGAGGGLTLTAIGTLSGNTGSGTFNRSDGCIGSWIAIKR
jgi:hypothetical protein